MAVAPVDRGADISEAAAVQANRRRAAFTALVPGVVLGLIVGVVLVVVGLPLVGAVALVVLTAVVSLSIWQAAPGVVVRSVGARPSEEWEHPRLHNLVDGLCATMGLPRPAICMVESGCRMPWPSGGTRPRPSSS